jgi:hypothetical protein
VGNWQMDTLLMLLIVFTQFSPAGQSSGSWQAWWHLPIVHVRNSLQSLVSVHDPPTSMVGELSQPTASHDAAMVKPRMRSHDADILNLQFSSP